MKFVEGNFIVNSEILRKPNPKVSLEYTTMPYIKYYTLYDFSYIIFIIKNIIKRYKFYHIICAAIERPKRICTVLVTMRSDLGRMPTALINFCNKKILGFDFVYLQY